MCTTSGEVTPTANFCDLVKVQTIMPPFYRVLYRFLYTVITYCVGARSLRCVLQNSISLLSRTCTVTPTPNCVVHIMNAKTANRISRVSFAPLRASSEMIEFKSEL